MAGDRRGLSGLHTDEHRALMAALAAVRVEAKLTQEELGKRLGVDQTYVSKYETGRRRLDVVEFMRIIAALEANPSDLLARVWPKR
ncbi:helix-turn-helix transcriptional regulator [Brevundimonas sp.]|uniref:helix-turn-helix domain-containing protein n=1 Tax=Brevundimonas sp. TaxID=1871086 RepID=UPI002D739DB9|nr:helix-turn-helix transcriptional regulator [Brevundimonas sp.]HYC68899.1 helix-turn-helix transcriptional regulator [Brevundimonas sp.]